MCYWFNKQGKQSKSKKPQKSTNQYNLKYNTEDEECMRFFLGKKNKEFFGHENVFLSFLPCKIIDKSRLHLCYVLLV